MSRRASCYTTRIGKFIEFWTHLQIKKLNFSPRNQKFIIPQKTKMIVWTPFYTAASTRLYGAEKTSPFCYIQTILKPIWKEM